ncbi:uncharacterized protein LOC111656113 [Seriola lalandi dorsalis]|uniref:uncharacterized protein LOC111656113 n=1 Tax=Seriola lalandi dorsalis TaxID=1841481 RepID=UPI000C6F5618|nr:uncharacterized protein LOC111656113 [Seriola lalandi dorsalis]
MKEAEEIAETIQNLEKGIQKLMKTLAEEGKKREQQARAYGDITPENYVVEKILRAIAKRNGLEVNDKISLHKMVSHWIKTKNFETNVALIILSRAAQGLALLGKLLIEEIAEEIFIETAKKTGKKVISKGVSKGATSTAAKGASKAAASMAPKVAAKAVGRIAGGAVGLAFSIPELVINCKNLDNCETEASQRLRENAEAIQKASEEFKKSLDEIQNTLRRLARVKLCIENTKRSSDQRKELIEFAIRKCQDEAVRQWLRENSESEAFFSLVDMFHLVEEKLDEEEKKNHSNIVDITFLAHGSITGSIIPASCLLPLPTITDVVLYSPWNCYLTVDAAYDVATGLMKPQHRDFLCSKNNRCQIPNEKHRPTNLPDNWNSMKKAVDRNQKVPNIMLSPVGQIGDGAWKRFELLINNHGQPGRNRIIIPYILPEKWSSDSPKRVPFSVVSLALSLVLVFSRFTAVLHLTACLGKSSARQTFDREYLQTQYSCTIDHTTMTSSCPVTHRDRRLLDIVKRIFD